MQRQFDVVIELDEEGFFVASVPQLLGCPTQARSLEEIIGRVHEAAELRLAVDGAPAQVLEFVSVQRIIVAV